MTTANELRSRGALQQYHNLQNPVDPSKADEDLLKAVKEMQDALVQVANMIASSPREDTEQRKSLLISMNHCRQAAVALLSEEAIDKETMRNGGARPFLKQATNYGSSLLPIDTFDNGCGGLNHTAPSSVMARVSATDLDASVGPNVAVGLNTTSSLSARNVSSDEWALQARKDIAEAKHLFKPRKKRKQVKQLQYDDTAFERFCAEISQDTALKQEMQKARDVLLSTGFSTVRSALNANCMNRVRFLASNIVGLRFAKSIHKKHAIASFIDTLKSAIGVRDWPESTSQSIADVGIVMKENEQLAKGTIVVIESNALSNTGEKCVSVSRSFVVWYAKDQSLSRTEISEQLIYWGKLVECRKGARAIVW